MRKGHDFKDYICPDSFEFEKDYFRIGNRYGRVIFLREYAAYIKDSIIACPNSIKSKFVAVSLIFTPPILIFFYPIYCTEMRVLLKRCEIS